MDVSKNPVHEADRVLEKAQAFLAIINCLAEEADDDNWLESRHGISLIARQAKQAIDDARDHLDRA